MPILRVCQRHGETPHYRSGGREQCKQCNSDAVLRRRRLVRNMLLDERGAKCERCGYDRCRAALDWHHRDPSQKSFQINDGQTRSLARMRAEVAKCDLLCANCHREEHAGED